MMTKSHKPLSILFLGSQMTVGGAQNLLFTQARWFYSRGYRVVAAFFYDKDGLHEDWQAEQPFPVENLGALRPGQNKLWNLFRFVGAIWRTFVFMRRERFDIIETFTPHSNLLGIPIAWLADIPVRVPTHHGHIPNYPKWLARIHGRLPNWGLASCMLAVSEQVRRMAVEFEGTRPDKVSVIINGIEPPKLEGALPEVHARKRQELGLTPDDVFILTVGRVATQKGHTHLLDAIPQVVTHFPQAVFAIAGDGHLREELEAKAVDLGLGNSLRFLGSRSDIPELLAAADIFVLSSLWEGLPLALLEAMAMGLPVVSTQVEGVVDVVIEGQTGHLVPIADPDALGAAILRLVEDGAARQRLGANGKNTILENYTVDGMCQKYERLFVQILDELASD
jgi:glycosyltransferase involved in cell wall biosynthesis